MKYYKIPDELLLDIFCKGTLCINCSYKGNECKDKALLDIHEKFKTVEIEE